MQSSIHLFVYGSLRKGFQHPAYTYISRYFTLAGDAKVKGLLYDLGDFPAAVPTENEAFILGELYSINNPDELSWAIAQLDDYEGLHTEAGETPLYRRELTTVFLDGRTEQAWIYWFNKNIDLYPLIDSGDVLDYLQRKQKSNNG